MLVVDLHIRHEAGSLSQPQLILAAQLDSLPPMSEGFVGDPWGVGGGPLAFLLFSLSHIAFFQSLICAGSLIIRHGVYTSMRHLHAACRSHSRWHCGCSLLMGTCHCGAHVYVYLTIVAVGTWLEGVLRGHTLPLQAACQAVLRPQPTTQPYPCTCQLQPPAPLRPPPPTHPPVKKRTQSTAPSGWSAASHAALLTVAAIAVAAAVVAAAAGAAGLTSRLAMSH
jgi:hypothetical protein